MEMFLETDLTKDSESKWIWSKKGDTWFCDWYWNTAMSRWEPYGLELKDVFGKETEQGPSSLFGGKFTKIDEDDLFAILL